MSLNYNIKCYCSECGDKVDDTDITIVKDGNEVCDWCITDFDDDGNKIE